VPFTLSHAAAALPLRRARLVLSALVIGTFAPDLEYFIRLVAGGGWGHTLVGVFALDLPLGLAALWMFHRLVKFPLASLLPDSVRARLTEELAPFRFGPLPRFLLIIVSLLIGIATHLLWDGFTHPQYWIFRHLALRNHIYRFPLIGWESTSSIVQSMSSAGGLAVLAVWCVFWYRRNAPNPAISPNPFTPEERKAVVLLAGAAAVLGSFMRAWLSLGIPTTNLAFGEFMGQVVVTFGALCWWQLAMWGIFGPFRRHQASPPMQPTFAEPQSSLER
jgi:hypothetical protein